MLLRANSALLKGLAFTLRPDADAWLLPCDLFGLSSTLPAYCLEELESEFLSAFLDLNAYPPPPEGCSPSFFLLKNLGFEFWKLMDYLSWLLVDMIVVDCRKLVLCS